jgi:predicted phosphate transport protein (TIGR00153 family)
VLKLLPREENFLPQFNRTAEIILEAALVLDGLATDFTDVEVKVGKIKHLEHEGDQVTHQSFALLSRTWITPIDREDIHDLTKQLDDVLDLIDAAAARLVLFKIPAPTPELKAFTHLIVQSAQAIQRAMGLLSDLKNSRAILDACIEINRLENEGDTLNRAAIKRLFENEKDPFTLMKWKEIYEVLETATDACEDVANVLEQIVLKSS